MAKFELVRSGCGWPKNCPLTCGGRRTCSAFFSGDLEHAIGRARELIQDEPLAVVEVRRNGHSLCSVGYGWTSHHVPDAARRQPGA